MSTDMQKAAANVTAVIDTIDMGARAVQLPDHFNSDLELLLGEREWLYDKQHRMLLYIHDLETMKNALTAEISRLHAELHINKPMTGWKGFCGHLRLQWRHLWKGER